MITLSTELLNEAICWRQDLHRHPELAFNERRTSDFIATRLAKFGLEVHRGLAGTGVVGTLSRGTSSRTIGIRADMDALPIDERSGVEHSSCTPGRMHACGHDGHSAMLLAAARACTQLTDLEGTVHFIFQPAEEGGAGARRMIEEGLFRRFPCERIFALHNWPALPLGAVVARDGPMMAASATFEIELQGRGSHGAMPHEGRDVVTTAGYLIGALQSIVSRNIDPVASAVVSVTQVHAGNTHNVIPDRCVISGIVRWLDEVVGRQLELRMTELAQSLAAAFGCSAKVDYVRRYPVTVNDPAAARLVRAIAADVALEVSSMSPTMGGEDFSFMLQVVPGCFLWLGTGKPSGTFGLHSPHYDFNDEALPHGVALWTALVQRCLRRETMA